MEDHITASILLTVLVALVPSILHADHDFKTGTIKYVRRSPSWRTAEANKLFEKLWGAFAATYSDKKHGCYFAQAQKGADINVSERPLLNHLLILLSVKLQQKKVHQ